MGCVVSTCLCVHLSVCYYRVTYVFQSESILYSCLNVKELLARNRCNIWYLSGSIGIWTHNHLECRSTLKRIRDMITYSQMHRTDKYSQHSSIIWPVWLNGWVFVYKLGGCGFESCCCHLKSRYCACFEQGVSWHSGNYGL